jgi:hypothetical protein
MKDYEERLSLAEMALNISIAAFPAHKGVRYAAGWRVYRLHLLSCANVMILLHSSCYLPLCSTSELIDLSTPLASLPKRRPACNSYVDYRCVWFLACMPRRKLKRWI